MLAKNVSKLEVRIVFCGPMPAYHLEILKVLIKKAALRKLERMVQVLQKEAF